MADGRTMARGRFARRRACRYCNLTLTLILAAIIALTVLGLGLNGLGRDGSVPGRRPAGRGRSLGHMADIPPPVCSGPGFHDPVNLCSPYGENPSR